MNLLGGLGIKGKVLYNEPLFKHTTFKIGGPVKVWAAPDEREGLKALLEISQSRRLPVLIIGEGSNLLVSDKGLDMMAVSLRNFRSYEILGKRVWAQAGLGLGEFILKTIEAGFFGLEFMAGIPGTIGGAIKGNAGAGVEGPWFSDFITRLKVCTLSGEVRYIEKGDLRFGYRSSSLEGLIILEAEFNLNGPMDKGFCKEAYMRCLAQKRSKQELSRPSAGCIFKNPKGAVHEPPLLSAAQLIEGCGLKGERFGDAVVSEKHANFIVNLGRATFKEVMQLIELIRARVQKRYNVTLETEVQILE